MKNNAYAKRFICYVLVYLITLDKSFADTSGNPYMAEARDLLKAQSELSKALINLKYNQILATESAYISGLSQKASLSSEKASENIKQVYELVDKYKSDNLIIDDQTYQSLIRDEILIKHKYKNAMFHLSDLLLSLEELSSHKAVTSDFCSVSSKQVDAENIKANPSNHRIRNYINHYTKHDSVFGPNSGDYEGWTFSSDPMVEGAALMATGAVVVGTYIYAVVTGVKTGSIFASGSSLVVSFSGPQAAFVAIAVVVIAVVSHLWTNSNNEKRRKKAEERYKKEMELYEEASSYFRNNQIKQAQYEKMAEYFCKEDESIKRNLQLNQDNIRNLQSDADIEMQRYRNIAEALKSVPIEFQSLITNYSDELAKQYSKAFVKKIEDQIRPVAESQLMLQIFNEETKPLINDAISNMRNGDCWSKYEIYHNLKAAMKSELEILNFGNDKSIVNNTFQDISDQINSSLEVISLRLSDCVELPEVNQNVFTL